MNLKKILFTLLLGLTVSGTVISTLKYSSQKSIESFCSSSIFTNIDITGREYEMRPFSDLDITHLG